MKPNKLTPGANIMWESSRMIIPQHKEATIRQAQEAQKRERPDLTEEELQEMFGRLSASKANTLEVTITVYGDPETRKEIRYQTSDAGRVRIGGAGESTGRGKAGGRRSFADRLGLGCTGSRPDRRYGLTDR